MNGFEPNLVAVLVAAVSGFVIGGLWYSPLLVGKVWMAEAGITEEQVNAGHKGKIFGISFVALLIMSYCLEMFMGPSTGDAQSPAGLGAFYGFLTGFGWIFFAFVVVGLFELRSWKYICVNGGYWVIAMTAMGAILGAWS